jgi:transcriptional regulator with XRE-family HTH domain
LQHDLIKVQRASEVVPALCKLIPGLSAAWAYKHTTAYRQGLIAKRDRLIAERDVAGKTQQEIADELEVDQKTVANVLARLRKNSTEKEIPKLPELPEGELPPEETENAPEQSKEPAFRRDYKGLLSLLDEPPVKVDDSETGIVAGIEEEEPTEDPEAKAALDQIDVTLDMLFADLADLKALEGHFTLATAMPVQIRLISAVKFLSDISNYLAQRGAQT